MKPEIRKILVALKPWQEGLPLSAYHARFLAESLNAQLRLVSCIFDPKVALGLTDGDVQAAAAQTALIAAERETLQALAHSLGDWGASVEVRVRWGLPIHEIVLKEVDRWHADLLVVGAHAPAPRPHIRLTDVDWQLMRLCPRPLLLVKDAQFEGYPSVLAAVDPLHRHAEPSGLDRTVLETAHSLAGSFGATLGVVHAYPDPDAFALASAVEVMPGVFYGTENIPSLHEEAVEELVSEYGVTRAQMELRAGDPADVILAVASEQKAKLIVLGGVKRGRLKQAVLGSTAENVAAASECDVLLVK